MDLVRRLLCDWPASGWLISSLLLGEIALSVLIVLKRPYTEIDWNAYMDEVKPPAEDYIFDYMQLRGATGPLVYPGGFVALYGALRAIAGGDGTHVRTAQWVFVGVYVGTLALVAACYAAARPRSVPPWVLLLLCGSLRLHSIYVLRLFNDCWAMLLAWAAFSLFCRERWAAGCVFFSLGVGVKMSVLLYAPGLLFLLLEVHGVAGAVAHIAICAVVQLLLGLPFLAANWKGYMLRAFGGFGDLNQKWSVNWKMLPAEVFGSRGFAPLLLALHLTALGLLAAYRWGARDEGGMARALRRAPLPAQSRLRRRLCSEHVLTVLLGSMAVGVGFARSLHYQFYCWYWHSVPWLLWRCDTLPTPLRLLCLLLLEYAWSYGVEKVEGTPTPHSALALQLAHLILLAALALAPPTTAFQCVPQDDACDNKATALVELNREHAEEVEAFAARRGGVTPAEARGAVLVAADVGVTIAELTVQLWDGKPVKVPIAEQGKLLSEASLLDLLGSATKA